MPINNACKAGVLFRLGLVTLHQSSTAEPSFSHFTHCLEAKTQLGEDLTVALDAIALEYAKHQLIPVAIQFHQQSLEIKLQRGNPNELSEAFYVLGKAFSSLEQFEKAQAAYEEAIKQSRPLSLTEQLVPSLCELGSTRFKLGKTREAIELFSECIATGGPEFSSVKHRACEEKALAHTSLGEKLKPN